MMKLCKKLIAALLVAVMLYTMAFSGIAAPVAVSESISEATGFSSQTGKTLTVKPSENDAWTKVPAGETFESGGEDGFTYTGNSDVWINAEPLDAEEISFAEIFDLEPDSVETVEGEDGRSYTVRTYSSAESVEQLNKAFAAYNNEEVAEAGDNTCIVEQYADDELVDVIVVLEDAPVAETVGITLGGLEQRGLRQTERGPCPDHGDH